MRSILRLAWTCVLLLALLALPGNLSAEIRFESDGSIGLEGLRDPETGWLPVAKGVWKRTAPDGRSETYAQGSEGLAYVLPTLRTHLVELVEAYLAWPDDERRASLDEYTRFIEKIERAAAGTGRAPASRGSLTKTGCQYNFSYGADAFPTQCTNNAAANASYSSGNGCESCEVYAYAYVERTCAGTTTTQSQSCFDSGVNVSCSASASLTGRARNCYSYAFASIYCSALNSLYLSASDTDTSCGTGLCQTCLQTQPGEP